MDNEKFQELLLQQFEQLNKRLSNIENKLDIHQNHKGESINILALRQLQAEANIEVLKKECQIEKKTDNCLERIENRIDILEHLVAAHEGEIKLLKHK